MLISSDTALNLYVSDDGCDFDQEATRKGYSYGLLGVSERARLSVDRCRSTAPLARAQSFRFMSRSVVDKKMGKLLIADNHSVRAGLKQILAPTDIVVAGEAAQGAEVICGHSSLLWTVHTGVPVP